MNAKTKKRGAVRSWRSRLAWALVPFVHALAACTPGPEAIVEGVTCFEPPPDDLPLVFLEVLAPDTVVMVAGDRSVVELDATTNNTRGRNALPTVMPYHVQANFRRAEKTPSMRELATFSVDDSIATAERPNLAKLSIETNSAAEPGVYHFDIFGQSDRVCGRIDVEGATMRIVIVPAGGSIETAPVRQVAGGLAHTLAVLDDGSVWAWGDNQYGQLGDGTYIDRSTPVRVADLDGVPVRAVAAGRNHSVALGENGRVYTWGANDRGQLSVSVKHDARYACRGPNTKDHDRADSFAVPRHVITYHGIGVTGKCEDDFITVDLVASAIAAGADHTLALTPNGVVSFGHDDHGQLGVADRHRDFNETAQLVDGLPEMPTAIAAAGNSSFVLLANGQVWGWGDNGAGQLGVVAGNDVPRPREIGFAGDVQLLAPGAGFVLARRTGEPGFVSWGGNGYGQLGDGTLSGRDVPSAVATNLQVYQLAAGHRHAVATLADGRVHAWGDNNRGQLGVSTLDATQTTPLAVPLTGMISVAAGAEHSLARHNRCGTLWSFGQNHWGQLGHGQVSDSQQRPLPIYGLGEAALGASCELGLRVWQRGEGSVTATGGILGGQGCDETYCAASVIVGTTVELLATPADGFVFERWAGDCDGTDPRATVELDSSRNCIAVYAAFDAPQSEPPVADTPPTASITFDPATPVVNENVLFFAGGTDDGTIVGFEWDFDDDGVFEEVGNHRVGYVFTTVGTHRVHLRITDDAGLTDVASVDIDVGPAPAGATLTLIFAGGGAGRVDGGAGAVACSQDCSVTFPPGEIVTLFPAPLVGSVFSHWGTDPATSPPTFDCDEDLGIEGCTVTMNDDRTVRVYFE